MWNSALEMRLWGSKREPFRVLLPLLRHVAPLNDGNCRLTMPVGKGCWARDALSHTSNVGGFNSVKNNSHTIKYIYNESVKIIVGCNVAFHTNDCGNFPKTVPVFESIVAHVRLRCTRDYLRPSICSLIMLIMVTIIVSLIILLKVPYV